jgi:hypothetical protein
MKKYFSGVSLMVMFVLVFVATSAHAIFPPASLTELSTAEFEAVAGLVIVALAVMWAIGRGLGLVGSRK